MKSHELARELLAGDNCEVTASVDISDGGGDGTDGTRRLFTTKCLGTNGILRVGGNDECMVMFTAGQFDNDDKPIDNVLVRGDKVTIGVVEDRLRALMSRLIEAHAPLVPVASLRGASLEKLKDTIDRIRSQEILTSIALVEDMFPRAIRPVRYEGVPS